MSQRIEDRFSFFLDQPYQRNGDRRNLRGFKAYFIYLIISVLYISISINFANSQIPNNLAFEALFRQFLDMDQGNYADVKGYYYSSLEQYIHRDSSAKKFLHISEPDVQYHKVGKGKFNRTIAVDFSYTDSIPEEGKLFHMEQSDTLTRSQVKLSRDIEEKSLRGNAPFFLTKFIVPAVGTLAGIAGIISLFYVRS